MTSTIDRLVAAGRFGGEVWRLNLSERFGEAVRGVRFSVDGDLLVVEDSQHRIHAITRDAGEHRWFLDLPAATTQTVGGTTSTLSFVCTDDVASVTRSRGSRTMGTQQAPRTTLHLPFFPSGRAAAVGDSVYIGRLAPFSLQAIDQATGHVGWSYTTSSPICDCVVYGDGAVAQILALTEDGLLFSMPPRAARESAWSPEENWHRRLPGTTPATPMALHGDHLLFGTKNGFLYDVDARNGGIRWKSGTGRDLHSAEPVVADDGVYQRSDDGVTAYELASGAELWHCPGATRVITRIGDRVYVEMGGEIAVLSAATGSKLSSFASEGLSMPTVPGGGALIASDGTNVFALN
jgi:outer membrane protein assembly factor BamB